MRICYQPIICLDDMQPESAEILVRAVSPSGVVSGPEAIIAAMTGAETSLSLTIAIIKRALDEYQKYGFAALDLRFAVNLPLDVLLHPDLVGTIDLLRADAGLPAEKIGFELTEHHPVRDIGKAAAAIEALRRAGYAVALDDITPDMVNLDALLNLPIQAIKLDRSIVTSQAPAALAFIARIAAFGRAQGKAVIAEGFETAATLQTITALGCSHGQGFYFCRPLAGWRLKRFLQGWGQRKTA